MKLEHNQYTHATEKEAKRRARARAHSHCTHTIEKIIDVGKEKEAKRRARARERGG